MAEARSGAVQARQAGAHFVVAMVPLPFDQLLREALDAREVDLLVSSRSKDAFAAEESRLAGGATRVAQVQSKGRSLLRVDVFLHDGGRVEWLHGDQERDRELYALDQRIELIRAQLNEPMLGDELKALRKAKLEEVIGRRELLAQTPLPVPAGKDAVTARFIPLEENFPRQEAVRALETAYDVDVGLINLAWAKAHGVSCPPATKEVRGIVGSAALPHLPRRHRGGVEADEAPARVRGAGRGGQAEPPRLRGLSRDRLAAAAGRVPHRSDRGPRGSGLRGLPRRG